MEEWGRHPGCDIDRGLWTLLSVIYEDELIEEPQGRETIIENIEK